MQTEEAACCKGQVASSKPPHDDVVVHTVSKL
jgi:hypothetical protein